MINILVPQGVKEIRQARELRAQLQQLLSEWDKAKKDSEPVFIIENVKHTYRGVGWEKSLFSIQSAHDGNHWVWKATKVVVELSTVAWVVGTMLF